MRALLFYAWLAITMPCWGGWVAETGHELAVQGDFDGDGTGDLLVLDRASGILRHGVVQVPSGEITWAEPRATGAVGATSIAHGMFDRAGLSFPGLAVTEPTLNRVQLVFHHAAEPQVMPTRGIGPNSLITLAGGPGLSGDLLVASVFNGQPDPFQLGASSSFTLFATTARLERGQELAGDSNLGHAFLARAPHPGGTDSLLVYQPGVIDAPSQTVTGLPRDCDWAAGRFSSSTNLTHFLFWTSGQATLHIRTYDSHGSPPAFDAGATHNLAQNVEEVVVLAGTPAMRLLIIFSGGASAGVFDFDGSHPPVLVQSFAPDAGAAFRLALDVGATGDFHLFSGDSGGLVSNTVRRYRKQANGTYAPDAPSALPGLPSTPRRTNLLIYSGEPFVDNEAQIVSAMSARDWTLAVSGVPNMIEATAETYLGASTGLGQPQSLSLGNSTQSGSHALPNQIFPDVSMVVYTPPLGVARPALEFSPPPGRYPGRTWVRLVSTSTADPVYFRTQPNGAWQNWFHGITPPIQISQDTTLQAFQDRYGQRSPILTGTYTLGMDPPAPATGTDADNDGLGDEWERYFGISNPGDDADGDGYTNKQEHDAMTDPGDPASHPEMVGPRLLITDVSDASQSVSLRLHGTPGLAHRVEWSATLENASWTPLGGNVVIPAEGFVEMQDHGAQGGRRFYRATRL